ncbi:MAG: Gx transporter family protein [Bacilli bacterium]|nr:Gx transporter family protein [Bacilli bacterium]
MELKKFTRLSMFLALSVVLNLIENIIPLFNGQLAGIKLGLANIVIMVVLYSYTFKDALFISLARVFLVGILKMGLFSITFFFSLSGAILSIIAMSLAKKTKLSIIGVSIVGSIFHSIGQIIVLYIYLNTINAFYYLPVILIVSIPTGILTGVITKELLKNISLDIDK